MYTSLSIGNPAIRLACQTIATYTGTSEDVVTKTVEGLLTNDSGKSHQKQDRVLTKKEVCTLLNVSPATVNRLLKGGKLEKLKYSSQMVRIPESSVKKYIDSHRAGQL